MPYSITHLPPSCFISVTRGIILGMGAANERQRYIAMSSLIGWTYTKNDPWKVMRHHIWHLHEWKSTWFLREPWNYFIHVSLYPETHSKVMAYDCITEISWNFFALIKILTTNQVTILHFAHAMTAELSWHVQNCGMIWSLFFMQQKHVISFYLDHEFINS